MKTLIFCTSYASDIHVWNIRQGIWIKCLRQSSIEFDQLLIVDDASPVVPAWPGVELVREKDANRPDDVHTSEDVCIYSFSERLGRQDLFVFPGWFRSYAFGVLYGVAHGYEKIVHIESDAHIISPRLQMYINDFKEGWSSVWSSKYTMPEIAIQICAGRELDAMAEFAKKPYSYLSGRLHETLIPFTCVNRYFVGDRYGEDDMNVPANADFSTQTRLGEDSSYYWWLTNPRQVKILDVHAPFPPDKIFGGWSIGENGYQWMTEYESRLELPPLEREGSYLIEVGLFPCLCGPRTSQRLLVIANDALVTEVAIYKSTEIAMRVPAGVFHKGSGNCLIFIHPDAIVPSSVGAIGEDRNLSLAISFLSIVFTEGQPA